MCILNCSSVRYLNGSMTVIADYIVEENEEFRVIIQPTNPLDMVSTGGNTTTVTIVDDDGKHQLILLLTLTNLNN